MRPVCPWRGPWDYRTKMTYHLRRSMVLLAMRKWVFVELCGFWWEEGTSAQSPIVLRTTLFRGFPGFPRLRQSWILCNHCIFSHELAHVTCFVDYCWVYLFGRPPWRRTSQLQSWDQLCPWGIGSCSSSWKTFPMQPWILKSHPSFKIQLKCFLKTAQLYHLNVCLLLGHLLLFLSYHHILRTVAFQL